MAPLRRLPALVLLLASAACRESPEPPRRLQTRHYLETPSGVPFFVEDPGSPALRRLREREKLDAACPERDELAAARCLARWVRRELKPGVPWPYPPWDALDILDRTRAGTLQSFCGQYAVVLAQAAWSRGLAARYIDLTAPGGAAHFTTEFWSERHRKWVVVDAWNGESFRLNGEPLGGLELRELRRREKAAGLEVWDADRDRWSPASKPPRSLELYHGFRVVMRTNHLTKPVVLETGRDEKGAAQTVWKDTLLHWTDAGSSPPRFEERYRHWTWSGERSHFDWAPEAVRVDAEPLGRGFRLRFSTVVRPVKVFDVETDDGRPLHRGESYDWLPREGDILRVRPADRAAPSSPVAEVRAVPSNP